MEGAPLTGKTVIVTGASSGIGLATANLFIDEGVKVHAVARRREAMLEGAGEGRVSSGSFAPHALDVTDADAVERAVAEIGAADGVDVLVCAAGTNIKERSLERLTTEGWERILSANLSGAFHFVRTALPHLRRSRGLVILISSVSGSWPDMSGPAYAASKAGMTQFARAAGFEEHSKGVRFTSINPGLVDTPILDNRPEPPGQDVLAHALRPEDVAATCLFLATLPERAYVPDLTILPTTLQALGKNTTVPPTPGEG